MMNNFKDLDNFIKEELKRKTSSVHTNEFNPFYVTKEEVDALLDNKASVDETERKLPGLELLVDLFHLDDFEKKVLLIILAPEIDAGYGRIYAYLQDDLNRKYPTVSLISMLLSKSDEEKYKIFSYFSHSSLLSIFRLIKFIEPYDGISSFHQPIKVEETVRDFILGYYHLDNRLQSFCQLVSPINEIEVSLEVKQLTNHISQGIEENKRFVLHYYGQSDSQKKNRALEIASGLGYGLLVINMPMALETFESIGDLMELLYREAVLSGTLIYFDAFDVLFEHKQYFLYEPLLFDSLDQFSWLTFFSSEKQWKPKKLPKAHTFLNFAFLLPEYSDSLLLWERYLKEIDTAIAEEIAPNLVRLFQFSEDEIAEVAHMLKTKQFSGEQINKKTVYDTCREKVSAKLNYLSQNLKSSNRLKDIVLPEDRITQLKTIVSHYDNQYRVFEEWGFKKYFQSQGIGVLFTGSSGTGKTMAASILANEMGLDLYRIELSQVVSKYIGETEKNLSRIFEAAEGSGVVLFFDEADAMFGKRSETKDAHDRYANIEVSYLLQKIEEYDGLVILASNFRQNIDEAFVRRMRFIINFPFPDQEMRKEIWEKAFPKDSPLEKDLNFSSLSEKFALSGANIRNIALFSAFFAIEQKDNIRMEHIIHGLKSELAKIGKNYKISDFDTLKSSK